MGALLILFLVLLAVTRGIFRRPRRDNHSGVARELIIAEATHLFKEHKGAMLLVALVVGMIAGNVRQERG